MGVLEIISGYGFVEFILFNCLFIENGSYIIVKNCFFDFDYEIFYNDMYIYNCVF